MSEFKFMERRHLEEYLQMASGYVLDFSNRTFQEFVFDSIKNNEPESGLDRLHTLTVAFVRSLCEKHGIKVERDEPLHSLYGKYVKKLKELNLIETPMTERILKSTISILDLFNEVRNKKS